MKKFLMMLLKVYLFICVLVAAYIEIGINNISYTIYKAIRN